MEIEMLGLEIETRILEAASADVDFADWMAGYSFLDDAESEF